MGVSISRPPRCERGALPTELIAPKGNHKLAAAPRMSHQTTAVYPPVSSVTPTHATPIPWRSR